MKALVIHHDDADGRMGGYIMWKYFIDLGYSPVDRWELNYDRTVPGFDFLDQGDKVAIVDFSLNEDFIKSIETRTDRSNIIWIDHHKSSIENYASEADLDGIRFIGMSGCELAYIYTQGYRIKHDDKVVNISISNGELEFTSITDIEIPRGIKLIGDWDVWRQTPNSREFVYALQAIWPDVKLTSEDGLSFWQNIYEDTGIVDQLISNGKPILQYVLGTGGTNCEKWGFPVRIRKFENIEAIAINSLEKSSLVFESVKDQYEVGIVFAYNKKNTDKPMSFSIYRLGKNPDKDIDVSFIAKSFGGGGHHDASGFSTSGTLPFK